MIYSVVLNILHIPSIPNCVLHQGKLEDQLELLCVRIFQIGHQLVRLEISNDEKHVQCSHINNLDIKYCIKI